MQTACFGGALMLTENESTLIRRVCEHLLICTGGPCHDYANVKGRKQAATEVLAILYGVA